MPETAANPREPQKLEELLRIMDVATALRRERERAEAELDIDETKLRLRQRLAEAAEATGEVVSAAEIEAAIEQYYTTGYEFKAPKAGFTTFLAHIYIRRVPIFVVLALIALISVGSWWLFVSDSGPYSPRGRQRAQIAAAVAQYDAERAAIGALEVDAAVQLEIDRLEQRFAEARAAGVPGRIKTAAAELRGLRDLIAPEFTIYVDASTNSVSGLRQDYTDESGTRVSGYYLMLVARDPYGGVVPQQIRDAQTGKLESVGRWAELVPQSVYDRLKADKVADGVLDEVLYARKPRGSRELEIVMQDGEGAPLQRTRQLAEWR